MINTASKLMRALCSMAVMLALAAWHCCYTGVRRVPWYLYCRLQLLTTAILPLV